MLTTLVSLPSATRASASRSGLLFGWVFVLTLVDVYVGLPVLLAWMFVMSGPLSLPRSQLAIFVLLTMKVAWIVGVHLAYNPAALTSILPLLGVDVILIASMLVRRDESFLRGMTWPVMVLFLVDVLFNVSTLALGTDPLGREPGARVEDILPRLGGVFGHAFYSINISIVALLFAALRGYRVMLLVAVANIALNGSFRGWLTLAIGILVVALLWARLGRWKIVTVGALAAAAVFAATVYSAQAAGELTGNFFRVHAWVTALGKIEENPVVGTHTFARGELPGIDESTIEDFGIAESAYLNYAVHYGLFPAIAHLGVVLLILLKCLRQLYQYRRREAPMAVYLAALLAGVVFIDSFYGTVLGQVLTTVVVGLFCLSYRPAVRPAPPR